MQLTGIGLYTFQEATRLTGIKSGELRRWLHGYKAGSKSMPPLWETELAGSDLEGLSFHDLLEIRFVKEFRKYGVPLQGIRIASHNAREMFNSAYPFTSHRFQTDGKTIFWDAVRETGEQAMLDLRKKQFVFEKVIRPSLYEGIEFVAGDRASRWFPMKRSKKVVLDPTIAFGKPIITDIGIRTDILYDAWKAEEKDKRRVASQFEVPVKAVEAAIRFEQRLAA
ncbi:MAG: DUF433 domain-containing protein [Zetaproteobacteria bacterium CG12_big_fil_rev_8_21_14_0_65_54_13]|nr:MAG: DUF433 domain-containing protein [Zetaproteobacteria bacterium CG23_combo_of_CG06-09_8_20_14_all_54_7]PIW44122.1 MAG: DUF433 domain-containing protein [Zetaproteobacteria bacterium CG12_big_fil_rev_8_21_14_0_65_54_13]PIX54523.1 MAG: DUF433 domain-containing protein [Zetaproteobacteria bacterium CG_4_10_14_3_um_filter_54_28]PJA28697.1 MAG: DUF433 domain-containing protein [Zetaproteobacteria bacterium CG_4_9_14_3_um_filter_54_145]